MHSLPKQGLKRKFFQRSEMKKKKQLLKCAKQRNEGRDKYFRDAFLRILTLFSNEDVTDDSIYVYHRTCYATFTSKEKIENLKNRAREDINSQGISSFPAAERLTRSNIKKMDWNKCIICQEDKREH